MQDRTEKLIRSIYQKYKIGQSVDPDSWHLDEEEMAGFLEGKLSRKESEKCKLHFIHCKHCAELLALQVKLSAIPREETVPPELLAAAKGLVEEQAKISLFEIFLKLKEKTLELLHTNGDVIVGQELVPAPMLRSRKQQDFKDEVSILKDFQDIRVEVKIENKRQEAFSLIITAKNKRTNRVIKDLRVSLMENDTELESYLTETGAVTFEHVLLGKYTVEISDIDNKLASLLIDIKK